MATKKQNRRTNVRRARRALNSSIKTISRLGMNIHRLGWGRGLYRRSFEKHNVDEE